MNLPLISIAITTFNGERYIKSQILIYDIYLFFILLLEYLSKKYVKFYIMNKEIIINEKNFRLCNITLLRI